MLDITAPPIIFYTDGSADPKRKTGSWAYLRVEDDVILREGVGRVVKTDSARMEMLAVIEALSTLESVSHVIVKSDCRMLIEAMTQFVPAWKTNGWRKPKGNKSIPNVDLFIRLDELASTHSVTWEWVKGHSGNLFNERCDELCRQARGPQVRGLCFAR